MTRILAIETSCDDTSIAIVNNDGGVFNVEKCISYSQISEHQKYGGVVPEIASRLHSEKIISILNEIGIEQIKKCDKIVFTSSPGLPGSLLVGKTTAKFLSNFFDKEIIPIFHIHGHIFSILLERSESNFPLPWVILTASGGHNDIYLVEMNKGGSDGLMKGINDQMPQQINQDVISSRAKKSMTNTKVNKNQINFNDSINIGPYILTKLGSTLDDAAGECFDKVSRMLGGPYPGGAWIGEMAKKGKANDKFRFKRIFLSANELNFSFSGMKSQVCYLIANMEKQGIKLNEQDICDIAYEFQEAVVEVLAKKLIKAGIKYEAQTVGIVGGVSANTRLWEYLNELKEKKMSGVVIKKPVKNLYCTDNGAMIGVVGIIQDK